MENQEKTRNVNETYQDENGLFKAGNPGGPGRPKGSIDVRHAIKSALEKAGGENWLVQLSQDDPRAFAALVAKVIPKEIEGRITVGYEGMSDEELVEYRAKLIEGEVVSEPGSTD